MPPALPVPAVTLVLDGVPIDNRLMSQMLEVQVRDNLLLPDTAVVRFRDPDGNLVDDARFTPGKRLEVKLAAREARSTDRVFEGEVVAIEPEFTEADCVISMRAYDLAWRLNRQRISRTFQDMTAGDMVKLVAGAAGLSPGMIDAGKDVHKFFQQSMETDWEFCWRLARMNNFECVVDGNEFHFRPRATTAAVAALKWGENLLTFKPRLSGVGQVREVKVASPNPQTRDLVVGVATSPELPYRSAAADGRSSIVANLKAGAVVVADRVAETQGEAESLAQSTLDRLSSSLVEAEGKAYGDPVLAAGATVEIAGVGRFSGKYVLSQTTHRYGGGTRYTTSFEISGRTSHTFGDLLRRDAGADWSSSLVIGIVTNNKDPDNLGRVRVKFTALGDTIEGWWARVLTANAGKDRGMFYLPQIDDEVVVAFEHGDTRRPLVLGSLYNGRDTVPADLIDPSNDKKPLFGVKTPHQAFVDSKQKMTLRSHETMLVEIEKDGEQGTGDFKLDAKGNVTQEAAMGFKEKAGQAFEIDAGSSVKITGKASVSVETQGSLTLKGATVDIQATGPVNVKGALINLG